MIKVKSRVPVSTGQRIKGLMEEKGLSQKQLSKKLNIPEKTISKWVNDSCGIRISNLKILAEFFDVDVEYLQLKQINKHKNECTIDFEKCNSEYPDLANQVNLLESWHNYLTSLGCSISEEPNDGIQETSEECFIENGEIITVEISFLTATSNYVSVEFSDGDTITYTDEEWSAIQKEIADYTLFKLKQRKHS